MERRRDGTGAGDIVTLDLPAILMHCFRTGQSDTDRLRSGSPTRSILVVTACLLMAACAHDAGLLQRTGTLNAYRSAIRWNDFEQASAFQNGVTAPRRASDKLRDVRVTGYDVVSQREDRERQTMHQSVSIRYHHLGDRNEKTLVDEQDWHYDNARDKWVLDTGLPHFD